jgi:hypothetical protein
MSNTFMLDTPPAPVPPNNSIIDKDDEAVEVKEGGVYYEEGVKTDDEEEVNTGDEDGAKTDDEEEVMNDMVQCEFCDTKTHYSAGSCGKCGEQFKMSKSGYIMNGVDGGFICDEYEDIEYDTANDDCRSSVTHFTESDECSTSCSSDEDEVMFCVAGDSEDYICNKHFVTNNELPKRITRSKNKIV